MKNVLIFVAICLIGVGVYFGFIHKPSVQRAGDEVEIIPGIKANLANDGDAGEYYGKMIRSFLARRTSDRNPRSLAGEEQQCFILGTSFRKCNLYPGQFSHIMPHARMWETMAAEAIAEIMAQEAEGLWQNGRDREAEETLGRVAVFGWHVEQQNECLILNMAGVKIQYAAYHGLSRFHRARGRTEKAREYEQCIEAKKKSLSGFGVFYRIASWQHFEGMKAVALTHEDSLWRKEACMSMTSPFVLQNPRAQAEALQLLRTVAQNDPDPIVRQWAVTCVPYVDGTKKVPPAT